IGHGTRQRPHGAVDVWVTRTLQWGRNRWLDRLMVAVSRFGYSPWNRLTVVGSSLAAWGRWGWLEGAFLLLASGAGGISNYLLKRLFGRTRPSADLVEVFLPHEDYSFPSGHVMVYTTFFGFCAFLAWSRLESSLWRRLVLFVTIGLVLLIGPSRIYLGVHWLSDVVAAYLAGGAILLFVIEFYLYTDKEKLPQLSI
ncbi:MAG: phosphatase PAP2 family protein, partial [Chloroflexota bacterium]|nr:phosphatase PAP2 family protein [Chloroflexota bacterium]